MSKQNLLYSFIRLSLRHRGLVVALSSILLLYGLASLIRARYDVFPEFAPPQVTVQTEAPGLAPEDVEMLVTQPIENVISGVTGLESLRSGSIQGLSVVTVNFDLSSDIYRARQLVAERLTMLAGQLPEGVVPVLTPLTSAMSTVLVIGLTSSERTLMDLRTIAQWTIQPALLAVPGVAKVVIFGGDLKQYQIQFDPDLLIKYDLSLAQVVETARLATAVRGAGFVDTENQRLTLQSYGQMLLSEELAQTVVLHQNSANVTLSDVGVVTTAPASPIGMATVQGKPGVQLLVSEQYGANTLNVTHGVDQALQRMAPIFEQEGVDVDGSLFRPAQFIERATRNVVEGLAIGGALVILVLLLFLSNLRASLISIIAIPLALLIAIVLIQRFGLSLNTMTLGGLGIAIGLLVDDAVITVENIFRRLRLNQEQLGAKSRFHTILDATFEVRSAVVYATLAVALVFIPVLTISGVAGRLFEPLGIAYITATLASLLVALTVTPSLAYLLFRRHPVPHQESRFVRWIKGRYAQLLKGTNKACSLMIAAVAALVVIGAVLFLSLGHQFLPELEEGHFTLHMTAIAGTSIEESLQIGQGVTERLLEIPGVAIVAQRIGRAELGDDVYGTQDSEFEIGLTATRGGQIKRIERQIREVLADFPGVAFAMLSPLMERIDETLSGYTAELAVNIFGNDLGELDRVADQVVQIMEGMPGAEDVALESVLGAPELYIKLRQEELVRWGLRSVEVLDAIRAAYEGQIVGQVYQANRYFDVTVILDPKRRHLVDLVQNLPLRNSLGTYIPLKQVAEVGERSGRYIVLHDGARRVQVVTCNLAKRAPSAFLAALKREIAAQIEMPAGAYIEYTGTATAELASRRDLLLHSLLAAVAIVVLLSVVLASGRNLLLVMVNLPFSLVGGILVAFIFGRTLSLGSLIGLVTLFGITLRNSIMLLSHYEYLVNEEGAEWGLETAIRGASERLSPILMTALATGFGLLPFAVGGAAGQEIEGPMARVILGGLVTSTLLNLLIMPALALRYGRFEYRDRES